MVASCSRVPLMEAKLIVVGGKATKGSISLKLPAIVGRSREAGVKIGHPMISRRHAELFEAERPVDDPRSGLVERDDDRRRGGSRAPLPPDAEFTIGPLTFRAEYDLRGRPKCAAFYRVRPAARPRRHDHRAVDGIARLRGCRQSTGWRSLSPKKSRSRNPPATPSTIC